MHLKFLLLRMLIICMLSRMNLVLTDLYLFPDYEDYVTYEVLYNHENYFIKIIFFIIIIFLQSGGLSLFPIENESPEPTRCDLESANEINVEEFCEGYCLLKCAVDDSKKATESDLNLKGILFHYRQFVQTFLNHIKSNENNVKHSEHYEFHVILTQYQINELVQFANSHDIAKASHIIQDVTDILNNMLSHADYNEQENFSERLNKRVVSFLINPQIQITICLTILLVWLLRHLCTNRLSVSSLIVSLLVSLFVISVVNNHYLLIEVIS